MHSFFDKFLRWRRFKKVINFISKDSVVCDLGCGKEAYFLKKILNMIKQGIGFDTEIENHKSSKLELKEIKIFENIPLEDETCEVITMMAVLEHLSFPQETLNESFRILKNGGKLILTTPSPLSRPILEFMAFKLRLIDKNEIRDHKNYFWPKDINKMLQEAGFKEGNIKISLFELYFNQLAIARK